ncbi:MAG: hypothetical protein ACRCZ2_07245 [Fusobacteriaceae bacterium]
MTNETLTFGPCQITIGGFLIENTLESSSTKITIKKETIKVKPTCKGGAVVKTLTKITNVTAETTVVFTAGLLNSFEGGTGCYFNKDFLELKDVSVSFSSDEIIQFYKCNVEIEQDLNFKKNSISTLKLIITALKTDKGYYKIGR